MNSIQTVLKSATQRLVESDSPELDAQLLLAHCLDKPISFLFTWPDHQVGSGILEHFNALLERRITGEPIAYLLGKQGFWSYDFLVTPDTLIPRPDTECLIEQTLTIAHNTMGEAPFSIIDMGTGSGCIGLTLAKELGDHAHILCLDASEAALKIAKQNAQNLNINNAQFAQSNWAEALITGHQPTLEPWQKDVDIIVSNPPYIREDDHHLNQGDVRFEPKTALTSGVDGLNDIKTITKQAKCLLKEQGWLILEHGYDQSSAVQSILREQGYQCIQTHKDAGKNDRITLGQIAHAH